MRTFFFPFFKNFIMNAQRFLEEVNMIKIKTRKF